MLTSGGKSTFLNVAQLNKSLGLEMIESILSNHADLFLKVMKISFSEIIPD